MQTLQQNDVGTLLRVRINGSDGNPLPITGATVTYVLTAQQTGNRTVVACTPTMKGTVECAGYTTQPGDITMVGTWSVQAHYTTDSVDLHTDVGMFQVLGNL